MRITFLPRCVAAPPPLSSSRAAVAAGPLFAENVWTSRGPVGRRVGDGCGDRGRDGLCRHARTAFSAPSTTERLESSALAGQWINQVVGRSGASAVYARATGELHATRDGGETWSSRSSNVTSWPSDPVEASTV